MIAKDWGAIRGAQRRRRRLADLRCLETFRILAEELETRVQAIATNEAAKAGLEPRAEKELKRSYEEHLRGIFLGVVAGIPVPEMPPEKLPWRRGMLTSGQVRRFGKRECEVCGVIPTSGEYVYFQPDSNKMIRHELCHYRSVKSKLRSFVLEERHIASRGPRDCILCALPAKIGERVAYTPGSRQVMHVSCLEE